MTSICQKTESAITIKGSSEIVCDYLDFGINSILYQRGLYPPQEFKPTENYGLTIFMSNNQKIKEFLSTTLSQLKEWLTQRIVDKVSLIITNVKTLETMERWDFKIEYDGNATEGDKQVSDKPLKVIKKEIKDILIQITSSVTYLPLLDCLCSFDLQIYTKDDVTLPSDWADAEPAHIKNAQSVKYKKFSTNIHSVETMVTYKNDD